MGASLAPVKEKITLEGNFFNIGYGLSSMQGWRRSQEDAFVCEYHISENASGLFFGIFDGHGGGDVSRYAAANIYRIFSEQLRVTNGDIDRAFRLAFELLDDELRLLPPMRKNPCVSLFSSPSHSSNILQKIPPFSPISPLVSSPNSSSLSSPPSSSLASPFFSSLTSPPSSSPVTPMLSSYVSPLFSSQISPLLCPPPFLTTPPLLVSSPPPPLVLTPPTPSRLVSPPSPRLTSPPPVPRLVSPSSPPRLVSPPSASSPPAPYLETTGSTCLCIFFDRKTSTLHWANIGDSKLFLSKNEKATALTEDHTPKSSKEKQRILSAKGEIHKGRIQGILNVSRALGDFQFKNNQKLHKTQQMVIATPDTGSIVIDPSVDYVLMGSDGVWERPSTDAYVVQFLSLKRRKGCVNLTSAASHILDCLLAPSGTKNKKKGYDNMTLAILDFTQYKA